MSTSVFSLPIPLILLIHLHILEYPHANKPEYDHNIFELRVRGLKERTKLFEDVTYFLVGRLEGPASAKSILATYPCLVPSDTVAFRTSLSKYVESLRHNAIYPTSKATTGQAPKAKGKEKDSKGKGKEHPPHLPVPTPWWWKDVVVRKSLLEECAGERFERLLLALSTHALFKHCPASRVDLENLNTILRSQPTAYASLLRKYKHARHAWTHSASILIQREADLHTLKERLLHSSSSLKSKYKTTSTPRLLALVESKYTDLLQSSVWARPNGEVALKFLAEAAGIERPIASSSNSEPTISLAEPVPPQPQKPQSQSNYLTPASAQPLPIAAAHHPFHLKKLRKPVFADPGPSSSAAQTSQSLEETETPAARRALEAETRLSEALREALKRVQSVAREMVQRVEVFERRRVGAGAGAGAGAGVRKKGRTPVPPPVPIPGWVYDLWEPGVRTSTDVGVNFETRPTPELLASFSFALPAEDGLEACIDEIREKVLPAYPPLPDLVAPRIPYPYLYPQVELKKAVSRPAVMEKGDNKEEGPQQKKEKKKEKEKERPRKSIRVSLAVHAQRQHRLSLFVPPSSEDEDVHRMVHSVVDTSDDETKTTMTKVNRIFTGSRTRTVKGSTRKGSLIVREPDVPLGEEGGSEESEDEYEYGGDEGSMTLRDILLNGDATGALLDEGGEVGDVADGDGDESFGW